MLQSSTSLPPLPPAGLNYIDAIRPSLNYILVVTPLGAVLVPLIIVLFVFSPPHSRRHPVFILNVLACCTGIAEAVVNAVLEINQILSPREPGSEGLLTAVATLAVVSPLLIDSILLFRILAFYPFHVTPTTTLVAILAFPLFVKCGRLATIILFLSRFTKGSANSPIFVVAAANWPKNPYIMAEWTMQMVDNAYASSIFLYKIWEFRRSRKDIPVIRSRSLLSYLRSFFLIALGNFIFPIVMNIVSIVLIATDPSFVNGAFVLLSNNYVSILGIVFATIWTRKQNWNRREMPFAGEHHHKETHAESRFAFDPTLNTRSVLSTLRFGPASGTETEIQETANSSLNPPVDHVELGLGQISSGLGKKN